MGCTKAAVGSGMSKVILVIFPDKAAAGGLCLGLVLALQIYLDSWSRSSRGQRK